MAEGEEFAELAEINLNHHHHHQYGGHGASRWGGPGGGGVGGGPGAGMAAGPGGRAYARNLSLAPPTATSYEAEDAIRSARHPAGQPGGRGGAGSYYSPPGTSYTVVERPASAPRGTYLGGGAHSPPTSRGHLKKRPISPEQVHSLHGTLNILRNSSDCSAKMPLRPVINVCVSGAEADGCRSHRGQAARRLGQ